MQEKKKSCVSTSLQKCVINMLLYVLCEKEVISQAFGSAVIETTKMLKENFNDKIIHSSGMFSFKSRSKIHCGIICAEMQCPSYFYNSLVQTCQINFATVMTYDNATKEPGWSLYADTSK